MPTTPAAAPRLAALRRRGDLADAAAVLLLPGALAGAQLAGLIFFLNPALPFEPAPVARGLAVYALLGALAGLALQAPFFARRPGRARRFLPWALTAVFAASALLDWVHASRYAFFLPPGINVRLIKAAMWLTLAAVIAFYTALLHTLHRRRYGVRSQLAFALLALASLYAVVERREAVRPPEPPAPRPSVVEPPQRPRLLVVGIEGATLDAILPLAGQGRLPFFGRMVRDGAYGRLASLAPNRRLPLWTTLATGKYPYQHGVVADQVYPARFLGPGARLEVLPFGVGFERWGVDRDGRRRTGADDRRALALWEVLPRLRVSSGMIGWPGSAPVSRLPRFAVSDRVFAGDSDGAARPPEVAERARLFRVTPAEVDPVTLARFGDGVSPEVTAALAGDLWRGSLARFLLEHHRDLESAFVELDGLAVVERRYFGGYAAAQFEAAQGADNREAARLVGAYYACLDGLLEELWEATPPPRLMAVVSAYGAAAPEGWARVAGDLAGRPPVEGTFQGSPDGVLVLYGEGVREGSLLTGAQLVDVAPTLLYGLGVPVARDLEGSVLTAAFGRGFLARHPLTFLPSYETLTESR
jgi:hypothetical protein